MAQDFEKLNIQWFPGHMTKAQRMIEEHMKQVDAVCEILDARIPMASRNPDIDRLAGDKPRIVVLNRTDLADLKATARWHAAFQRQGMTVLETDSRSGKGVNGFAGAVRTALRDKIEAYAAKGQVGRPMRVMVLGIPNVGKSTFINKVARRKAAAAGDRPGVTRGKQWITVDQGLELLDTPGIRKANRHAETAPADSLAAQVTSENPLAAQYADTILRRIVCCDTPETLEQYPDSATRDLLRHHPFRLERLRTPQRYIGLEARRAHAGALAEELEALAERTRTAAQTEQNLKTAYDQYQNFQRGTAPQQLAGLWEARTAAEKARNAVAEQEGKLAEYRENPLLQEMYREEETREAAWEAARTAVEQVGGDIRVCEKQIASCEAEQKKAGETAQQSADAARKFFAAHPLLEPLARTRMQALAPADKPAAAAQAAEKAQARLDDALTAYLTGTLEPAQKAYNEHYVCDYPLGLAGLDQYRAQHESLVRIDLERYAARLEQAQRDCKDRFRKDILFRMKDDIFNARRQFRELNKVMEQLTYGEEVYRFELEPSRDPQLAAFYQVIVDKGNQQMTDGDSLDNLAATADPAYERQVDALMEKIMADVDENTRARQEGRTGTTTLSDYVDYRTYLDYDIKVTNRVTGQQAYLSRVSRDSSGGENQAPFYVAICASLLQIYQKSENSIRLVLLDEAFSKMTSDRIRPMMELFRRMQLQVLLISTVEKSTAIQPYCDITYSIVRHGDVNAIAPFYRLNPSDSRQEAEP